KGIPIKDLLFSDTINAMVADGRMRNSQSIHRLLQIGAYDRVKQMDEVELKWGLNDLTPTEAERLADFELVDARNFILGKAQDHQVIIISEAHTKPEHRVFTRSLLQGLFDQGYRHLGLENITPKFEHPAGALLDSSLMERGYPLMTDFSGVYAGEPQYGHLIRAAINIGFQLFAYERNGSSASERDLQQAEHLMAYQALHPGEKIICHGGWYHAIERMEEKWAGSKSYWLAYHYKNLSGDDPLTIYQDALNEKKALNQQSSPYYDLLLEMAGAELPEFPVVPVNGKGECWRGPSAGAPFDILVMQPPIQYRNGLPSWLMNEKHSYFAVSPTLFEHLQYPVLLAVWGQNESELATPVFCMELSTPQELKQIPLLPGQYRLEIWDQAGNRNQISSLAIE
ncbi:MAG: hypothetical protein AAFU67_01720, partial [Bacteroidota bacterium]